MATTHHLGCDDATDVVSWVAIGTAFPGSPAGSSRYWLACHNTTKAISWELGSTMTGSSGTYSALAIDSAVDAPNWTTITFP